MSSIKQHEVCHRIIKMISYTLHFNSKLSIYRDDDDDDDDDDELFYDMIDRQKAFSLISSQDHCQRSSISRISDTTRAGFGPAQNLSSSLVEWSCAVEITTTPHCNSSSGYNGISNDFISVVIQSLVGKVSRCFITSNWESDNQAISILIKCLSQ